MNVTFLLEEPRSYNGKVIKKTISTSDREYDIRQRVESITIRLDAYEMEILEIKHMEGGDIAVIHNGEIEFSVMEEQP